jgi:hypothetical protein
MLAVLVCICNMSDMAIVQKRPYSFSWWAPATRCQNPEIRRKAIALLIAYPRTEGFADSRLTGRIAWKSMMLEESAHSLKRRGVRAVRAIPLNARIEEISIKYTAQRVVRVEFKTLAQLQSGTPGVVSHFIW